MDLPETSAHIGKPWTQPTHFSDFCEYADQVKLMSLTTAEDGLAVNVSRPDVEAIGHGLQFGGSQYEVVVVVVVVVVVRGVGLLVFVLVLCVDSGGGCDGCVEVRSGQVPLLFISWFWESTVHRSDCIVSHH